MSGHAAPGFVPKMTPAHLSLLRSASSPHSFRSFTPVCVLDRSDAEKTRLNSVGVVVCLTRLNTTQRVESVRQSPSHRQIIWQPLPPWTSPLVIYFGDRTTRWLQEGREVVKGYYHHPVDRLWTRPRPLRRRCQHTLTRLW